MNYVLHPEAALEHEQQVAYYQERQRDLGQRYHSAFRSAVAMAYVDDEETQALESGGVTVPADSLFGHDPFPGVTNAG